MLDAKRTTWILEVRNVLRYDMQVMHGTTSRLQRRLC
jgi:hypothetical protein